MWTGWGIRTLSSKNPAYDPFSYHRGSIWPHDNAIIAAGMKRYGFHAEANEVIRGILDAASRFLSYRLPELFAGLEREPDSFPVQYRKANIPQAWAAGAIFQMVQTMLGLEADVPNEQLSVDPTLPDWAPEIELKQLAVGGTRVSLRFWRDGAQSRFSVEAERGGRLQVEAKPEAAPRERVA
jgi:glycogen debranching enzyme